MQLLQSVTSVINVTNLLKRLQKTRGFYRKEMNVPQFQNAISYADLVIFVLLVIAFAGIFLVRRQVMQSKATFFKELYLLVFADPDISDAFYLLETRQFVYGETLGHSPQEQLVNRLLRFLDLVCEAYAGKLLTEQEMNFFKSQ